MKYTPPRCPKCGTELAKNPRGGRPTRWCCDGCKRSGEAELTRLQALLRAFEEGKYEQLLNHDEVSPRRAKVLAELQARYDHLAGVPGEGAHT